MAASYGDGSVRLTRRANIELRGLPSRDGFLDANVVSAIEATGLLPSRSHDLVRNIMVSPLTGLVGGRADLRPVTRALDSRLCADLALATLPARFLFVLDDGRGDIARRRTDLGLVALDGSTAQLRVGTLGWGPVLPLAEAPKRLLDLARDFQAVRGTGSTAAWHVDETDAPLAGSGQDADPRTHVTSRPVSYGEINDVEPTVHHVEVPDGVLTPRLVDVLLRSGSERLVVTPWSGVVVTTA